MHAMHEDANPVNPQYHFHIIFRVKMVRLILLQIVVFFKVSIQMIGHYRFKEFSHNSSLPSLIVAQ
jgi:hypothetical protein